MCFASSIVPVDWVSECVVSFYKGTGGKCECTSLSLLNVAGKVYHKVLVNKIREGIEGMICDDQDGV